MTAFVRSVDKFVASMKRHGVEVDGHCIYHGGNYGRLSALTAVPFFRVGDRIAFLERRTRHKMYRVIITGNERRRYSYPRNLNQVLDRLHGGEKGFTTIGRCRGEVDVWCDSRCRLRSSVTIYTRPADKVHWQCLGDYDIPLPLAKDFVDGQIPVEILLDYVNETYSLNV